jgi:hypothetical protein
LARALSVLALLLALLCLGGCGGGSSSQSSSEAQQEQAKSAPTEQNAEASIEGFGEEAGGSEREEVLGAFHAYLGALAAKDYQAACAHLAVAVRDSLSQLTKGKLPCSKAMAILVAPSATKGAAQQDRGKVTKVRVEGERGFVVFHAPGARLYQLTLAREGGAWKAGSAVGSVLAP